MDQPAVFKISSLIYCAYKLTLSTVASKISSLMYHAYDLTTFGSEQNS